MTPPDAAVFRTTERPRELGWLLRPSRRDWHEFIHQLDKLLSENLDGKALDAAGAPKKNASGDTLGSLNRMQEFMLRHKVRPDAARVVLKPLRDVREARQLPAHVLKANVTDRTYIHKQVVLLDDVNQSLVAIRGWLSTHPKNRDLPLPHSDESLGRYYRM